MQRRILLAVLGLIATLIILFYTVNSLIFQRSFRDYNQIHSQAHVELIPSILNLYMESYGSWEGIEFELVQLSVLAGTQVTIVDPEGIVVTSTGDDLIGSLFDDARSFSKVIPVFSADGVLAGTAYVTLIPEAQTVDQSLSSRLNQGVILSLATAVIAGIVIAIFLARSISAPIEEIERAAQKIAAGDYDTHVKVPPSNDEVAALATTFNTMSDRLEEHDQMRRDLVADVSHDLRTPLTVLKGYLDGLVDGTIRDRETAAKIFDRMNLEVGYMQQLVESLAVSAKWDSGLIEPAISPVDLYQLGQEVVERFVAKQEAGRFAITNTIPANIGLFPCDPSMIAQALSNLIENAIGHNPAGVQIELGGKRSADGVTLWVMDNGIGIMPEDRERIFQRFVRLNAERGRHNSGMGMGLSIVQSLVNSHGGQVQIEDGDNSGAKFVISLPIYSKSVEKPNQD